MNWIYFFVSYFVGMVVFSFTGLVIFIILFFGIPTTKKLERLGLIRQDNKIISGNIISIAVLSTILIVLTGIIFRYFSNQFGSFLVGCAFSFIFGISKVGVNKNNISDYVQNHEKQFLVHPGEVIEAILTNK